MAFTARPPRLVSLYLSISAVFSACSGLPPTAAVKSAVAIKLAALAWVDVDTALADNRVPIRLNCYREQSLATQRPSAGIIASASLDDAPNAAR